MKILVEIDYIYKQRKGRFEKFTNLLLLLLNEFKNRDSILIFVPNYFKIQKKSLNPKISHQTRPYLIFFPRSSKPMKKKFDIHMGDFGPRVGSENISNPVWLSKFIKYF